MKSLKCVSRAVLFSLVVSPATAFAEPSDGTLIKADAAVVSAVAIGNGAKKVVTQNQLNKAEWKFYGANSRTRQADSEKFFGARDFKESPRWASQEAFSAAKANAWGIDRAYNSTRGEESFFIYNHLSSENQERLTLRFRSAKNQSAKAVEETYKDYVMRFGEADKNSVHTGKGRIIASQISQDTYAVSVTEKEKLLNAKARREVLEKELQTAGSARAEIIRRAIEAESKKIRSAEKTILDSYSDAFKKVLAKSPEQVRENKLNELKRNALSRIQAANSNKISAEAEKAEALALIERLEGRGFGAGQILSFGVAGVATLDAAYRIYSAMADKDASTGVKAEEAGTQSSVSRGLK